MFAFSRTLSRGLLAIAFIAIASIMSSAQAAISVGIKGSDSDATFDTRSDFGTADDSATLTPLEKRIEGSLRNLPIFPGHADRRVAADPFADIEAIEPLQPKFTFEFTDTEFRRHRETSQNPESFLNDEAPAEIDLQAKFVFQATKIGRGLGPDRLDIGADTVDVTADRGFQWRPAIYQSFMMMAIQHGYALGFQEKTRRALKGPFFRDYWDSVKALKGWDDGNKFFTNYIAHPMQGALTGFIYLQNQPRTKIQRFGMSKEYWHDRLIAFAWSTAWSTQWELGPISQSSIGNVGLYGGMGYVDLVITPTVGTAWLVSEEALDRYVISKWETRSWTMKVLARMFLNPMRTIANLLRFQVPWYRERPVGFSRIPVGQLGG